MERAGVFCYKTISYSKSPESELFLYDAYIPVSYTELYKCFATLDDTRGIEANKQ